MNINIIYYWCLQCLYENIDSSFILYVSYLPAAVLYIGHGCHIYHRQQMGCCQHSTWYYSYIPNQPIWRSVLYIVLFLLIYYIIAINVSKHLVLLVAGNTIIIVTIFACEFAIDTTLGWSTYLSISSSCPFKFVTSCLICVS